MGNSRGRSVSIVSFGCATRARIERVHATRARVAAGVLRSYSRPVGGRSGAAAPGRFREAGATVNPPFLLDRNTCVVYLRKSNANVVNHIQALPPAAAPVLTRPHKQSLRQPLSASIALI